MCFSKKTSINKRLKDADKRQEGYVKLIDEGTIDAIPDDDLLSAVILYRLYKDKALCRVGKASKDISEIPRPCQYLFAADSVINLVYAEGLEQVFTADDPPFQVSIAIEGLRIMGLLRLAEVLADAKAIAEQSSEILGRYFRKELSWGELLKKQLWADSHDKFNEEIDFTEYRAKTAQYIRANQECFKGEHLI